jgi:hypothetical protein
MKKLVLIGVFSVLYAVIAAHPVHVTVTNIDFNASKKCFDISIKLFQDDFEAVVQQDLQSSLDLTNANERNGTDEKIMEYLKSNFTITINDKPESATKLKLVRRELQEGAVWLYLTYPLKGKITSLVIFNNLLNSLYRDMTNLTILKYGEKEDGYSLTSSNNKVIIRNS